MNQIDSNFYANNVILLWLLLLLFLVVVVMVQLQKKKKMEPLSLIYLLHMSEHICLNELANERTNKVLVIANESNGSQRDI